MVLESIGSVIGSTVRRSLRIPPLRALDSAGGLITGAAAGLAIVWVVAAAALVLPGQTSLRHGAQRSRIVRELVAIAPPSTPPERDVVVEDPDGYTFAVGTALP